MIKKNSMINLQSFISFIVSLLILILIYYITGIPENNLFFLTNLLIIITSLFGVFSNQSQAYSLSKMIFIFIFIFFGITPLHNEISGNVIYRQFAANGGIIDGDEFDIIDKIKGNIIILYSILFFVVGGKIKINSFDRLVHYLPEINKLNYFYYILFFSLSFLILYKWNFYFNSLLYRGTSNNILIQIVY